MTDLVTNSNTTEVTNSEATQSSSTNTGTSTNYQPPTDTNNEKLFTQEDVNKIVGKVRAEDKQRYNRDGLSQQQPQANIDEERVKQLAAQEAQKLHENLIKETQQKSLENDAHRIANEFFTKLSSGKDKYEDFEKVTADLELRSIPHIVQLANMFDNTADVMYDLAKYPSKIGSIQNLISINPKLAYNEMKRLSDSIKDNDKAANTKLPNDPLSQMLPSNSGTDNGTMSVSDLRRKYKG